MRTKVTFANFELWEKVPTTKRFRNVIETHPTIHFTLDYPLSTPYAASFTHEDGSGWTRSQFMQAVKDAYTHVYENAQEYGVWGHDMEDLCLEAAEPDSVHTVPGCWIVSIGS